jgi:hypothetical protein
MKGVAWFIIGILLMVTLSIVAALFAFGKNIIVEKRLYQEKILSTGNRIEMTGNLIVQSTDLATLQALYDIGNSNIAIESKIRYNDDEKLPYWSDEYEDYIKQATLMLAEKYFENYNKSFTEYFMDPVKSNERYKYWYVEWEKEMKIKEFSESYISLSFGHFNITYDDGMVRISKKYPLVSRVKTRFFKTIERGKEAVEMINAHALEIARREPFNILENIQTTLSDGEVSVSLKDKGDYIIVSAKENSARKFYLFFSKTQDYDNLGIRFVLNKKNKCLCETEDCKTVCWWDLPGVGGYECPASSCKEISVSLKEMTNIKKCDEFYILVNKNHPCDILS